MDNESIDLNELLPEKEQPPVNEKALKRNTVCLGIGTAFILYYMFKAFVLNVSGIFQMQITIVWLALQLVYRNRLIKAPQKLQTRNIGITNAFMTFIVIVVLFCTNVLPEIMETHSSRFYGIQKKWFAMHSGADLSGLPETVPDNVTDYTLKGVPSYLQGTGSFRVSFRCSDDVLAGYEAEYAAKAMYSFGLDEVKKHKYKAKEPSPRAESSAEEDRSFIVAYDEDFWQQHRKGAVVYVTAASHDMKRQHNSMAIINRKDGMAEFIRFG